MTKRNDGVSRKIVQAGTHVEKKDAPPVTLVETDPEPYTIRRSRDYLALDSRTLAYYFGKQYRVKVFDRDLIDSFAYGLLRRLGILDCLDASISFSDRTELTMEITAMLSKNLAVYTLLPQRYGHLSRNMMASALMLLVMRLMRYRHGHGLPFKSRFDLSKKEFGYVVDYVNDSVMLWDLAEYWAGLYHRRLKNNITDPI